MDTRKHVIHSARIVSGGTVTPPEGWVAFDGERIEAVGTGDGWRAFEAETTDADGAWLTPGFVDIHGHGGGSASFDDGAESIRMALAVHRAHGTTRSVLSLVTAGVDELAERVTAIATLSEADATILGSHLEGPFLDLGHKGAHEPELLRAPDARSVETLIEAGRGTIRQITIAPELDGGMDAVRRFVAADVAVAVGHTNADYAQAAAAFDAGASILTHAFNAMNGIHHRAPGPVAAATASGSVILEIVNDGVHVHHEVVRIAFESAPGRIALVTDAMAAAGAADGEYILGSLRVTVTDGVARLSDSDSIAGSTLTLDAALRRAVTVVGLDVATAVTALTETPARAIGRSNEFGRLDPGFAADAVLLDGDFTVRSVWIAGQSLRA